MVKVKVCGITNEDDARAAIRAGCDGVGFVFYRKSPRFISLSRARQIARELPAYTIKVGVFVNARKRTIERIVRGCRLDFVQLHGNETPGFCNRLKNYKVIKAFRVKGAFDGNTPLKYKTFGYLFDTGVKGAFGGTGRSFDWNVLRHFERCGHSVFLSGGLSASNVRRAIKTVRPDWVDVSSSVERGPGRKDHGKMKDFVRAAKRL